MSETSSKIEAQVESIHELQAVVNAMRAQAAGPARQAQAVLPGMRTYTEVIAAAVADSLGLLPEPPKEAAPRVPKPPALIVFCAEHGFAGALSRRLIESIGRPASARIYIVGTRGISVARERGIEPVWTVPMASHFDAVTRTADTVADRLYAEFLAGAIGGVDIVFAKMTGTASWAIDRLSVLPIDQRRFLRKKAHRGLITYLPPARLFANVVGEYFFASLAHAAMESFASENAARLATMESARQHIEEKLQELIRQGRAARQEQITSELLEVVTGTEALREET